jgi:hypothetical protein
MSSVPTVTLTKKELESKWKDLLGATLEAWAHMILFVRQVYPAESFCSPPTTLFGLRLHHNRHPAVAAYIAEAVKVALPSLISRVADSITLTIIETNPPLLPASNTKTPPDDQPPPRYDWLSQAHLEMTDVNDDDDDEEEGNRFGHGQQSPEYQQQQQQQQEEEIIQPEPLVLEKFELRFPLGQREDDQHNGINSGSHRPSVYTLSAVDYLEREMRAILLSVYAMKDTNRHGDSAPSESDSLSFTISLHVPEANASCDALDRAVATGEWRGAPPAIVPNHTTTNYSGFRTTTDHPKTPYVLRPLHTMDALTSPVGPVQFVVKYPRPVGQRLSRSGGGGPKRQRRSRHGSPDSSSTQSTPKLDF